MSPAIHAVQGVVSGAVLYPFLGTNAVAFGLAVVLIDMDHLIEYLWDTGDWSLRGFFVFYEILLKNIDKNYLGLSLFHTLEFYFLGLVVAQWFPLCYYIVAGCLFHHLLDVLFLWRKGIPLAKSFSVIDYILRKKRHIVSVKDILRHEEVNTDGIADIDVWKERWGIRPEGRR